MSDNILKEEIKKDLFVIADGNSVVLEKEKKRILDEVINAALFQINVDEKDLATVFRETNAKTVTFFSYGLPSNFLSLGFSRFFSNKLTSIFELCMREKTNFRPDLIILGSSYSDMMAEILYTNLRIPVVGFEGEVSASVITLFAILICNSLKSDGKLINSFNTAKAGVAKFGDSSYDGFKLFGEKSAFDNLNYKAGEGIPVSKDSKGVVKGYEDNVESTERYSIFQRVFSGYYITIKNSSHKFVLIVAVQVKGDPLQILSVTQGVACKIYLGKSSSHVSVYSDCNGDGFWMHVKDREIKSAFQWTIMDRHVDRRLEFFKLIPGI